MQTSFRAALLCAAAALLTVSIACGEPSPAPEIAASPVPVAAPAEAPQRESETVIITLAPTAVPAATDTPIPSPTPVPTPTEIPIVPPIITLTGGADYTVDADFTFTEPGYTAKDYLGRDLTYKVEVTGEVVGYLVGDYTLTYTVTDELNQTSTVVRRVTVQPVEMPEIVIPPEKTVYLTFDDGPSSYTAGLLDVLKQYDAKATFFIIANVKAKETIKRAYEEGHTIGVHSYNHDYREIYAGEEAFFADFWKTQEVIKAQTGEYARLFRFPGGSSNTASNFNKGIMTRLTKIMEDMGYRYFDWMVSAGDTSTDPYTTEDVKNRVISGIKRHSDYVVVLQHDIKPKSVAAVKAILDWGTKNGYTFRALDLTSPVVHSKINN